MLAVHVPHSSPVGKITLQKHISLGYWPIDGALSTCLPKFPRNYCRGSGCSSATCGNFR
ncbi:Protein of unknown function [Pyronema omphalodes CBS 100304]|uniref:Uncharacterized protein n=1 Tax=Pyronema omphalodes (strain CBS 100304) TaxID=1076935 RepID=U4LCR6_PYROM|nr:Protein of unknown function [Pyronema omphalodes CBS 100304]